MSGDRTRQLLAPGNVGTSYGAGVIQLTLDTFLIHLSTANSCQVLLKNQPDVFVRSRR